MTEADRGRPQRIRLCRPPELGLPAGVVSVVSPSRWANPYRPATRSRPASLVAVQHFVDYLGRNPRLVLQARVELAGLDLACWCAPFLPCHADVWIAVVNQTSDLEALDALEAFEVTLPPLEATASYRR